MKSTRTARALPFILAIPLLALFSACALPAPDASQNSATTTAASFSSTQWSSACTSDAPEISTIAASATESTTNATAATESTPDLQASSAAANTELPASSENGQEAPQEPFVYHGLVELLAIDDSFVIDQKYATTDNFTGVQHYDRTLCLVNRDIVGMLITANDLAKEKGLRLKIWDAYRPISVQQALHDSAPAELAPYVPAPGPYSMHARGITVDVTLCTPDGTELDMPTEFDDFSVAANSDYQGATEAQIANRELLNEIMTAAGFQRSRLEWWHFDGPNRDAYEILDVRFDEFVRERDAERTGA